MNEQVMFLSQDSARQQPPFVFTVDVEDWFQVENLRPACPRERWPEFEARVHARVEELLALCRQCDVKGTFFMLGSTAERHPAIALAIAEEGHEVACHGYNHELLTNMAPGAIREDIAKARDLLHSQTGMPIKGYRAPCFSITDTAIDILADLGFAYDSSLFPFAMHDRYGRISIQNFDAVSPYCYQHRNSGICEFLLPVHKLGPMRLPWAGGGYFRLFPYTVFETGVKQCLRRDGGFVFYMHPWEIDPGQPRVSGIKASHYFRHYTGLNRCKPRLEKLLARFGGQTRLCDLLPS